MIECGEAGTENKLESTQETGASSAIWKRTPFQHQIEMLQFHCEHSHSLDMSDVGTGKTGPLVTWLRLMFHENKIRKALVIAPNTILQTWVKEVEIWSDLKSVVLSGTKEKRIALLQQSKIADIYIINVEGVRVIYPQLAAANFQAIIVDEIHRIKNYKGSKHTPTQSFLVRELAKSAPYRKGASGTVLTNSIEDVWAIAQFIDPNILRTNFWGFRNRFLYNENATKPWCRFPSWQPRPGAVEEIKKLLTPYAIRFAKREILSWLPPILFQKRSIILSDEQRRTYNELKRNFITELDNNEEFAALNILERVSKLLQITSGFIYREGEAVYRFEKNAKLTELKNILEEIGDKKIVIWTAFREDANLVGQTLIEMKKDHAFITGATAQDSRQEIVDRFNGDSLQCLVCNAATAGEGLTILAEYAIYYSRDWKLGHRIQSLGRFDRPGSEKYSNVTVIDLVAENSVDEEVMKALENKEDLLKSINPESFRKMLTT